MLELIQQYLSVEKETFDYAARVIPNIYNLILIDTLSWYSNLVENGRESIGRGKKSVSIVFWGDERESQVRTGQQYHLKINKLWQHFIGYKKRSFYDDLDSTRPTISHNDMVESFPASTSGVSTDMSGFQFLP